MLNSFMDFYGLNAEHFLGAGLIVTLIMACLIHIFVKENTFDVDTSRAKVHRLGKFEWKPAVVLKYAGIVIIHLLVMFCIFTVGGISDAKWYTGIGYMEMVRTYPEGIFNFLLYMVFILFVLGFCPAFLTFIVGYLIMGLFRFEKGYSHLIFLVTFILSIVFWCGYYNDYNANIEYTTEVTESTEERELILFYEIPVQQVSGSISGGSTLGTGKVSGEIFTVDAVPYVYLNASGNGEWDSAPAKDSEIVFITENEPAKLVIVTTTQKEIKINNNDGTRTVIGTKSWVKYYFYLPQSAITDFQTE